MTCTHTHIYLYLSLYIYNYYNYSYIYLYLYLYIQFQQQKDRKLRDRSYVGEGLELSWREGVEWLLKLHCMKFLKNKKNQEKKNENLEISYRKPR